MTITKELIKCIHDNLDTQITIFNYDSIVKKTVSDFLRITQQFSEPLREEKMKALGNILHKYFYDIYEESLRDETCWNNYYNRIVTSTKTQIAEVNKEVGKENIPQKEEVD